MNSPYDHPEWRAFVSAIRADPADDTVRLVAADWLDERGEGPRAELIRAQVKLAFALHDVPNPDVPLLRERIRQLAGVKPRPDGTVHCDLHGTVVTMSRGFEEQMRCTAERWLTMGDALLDRAPLAKVVLTTAADWCHRDGAVYLYEGPPPGTGEVKGRRCRNTTPDTDGVPAGAPGMTYVAGLFAAEWPGVSIEVPPADPLPAVAVVPVSGDSMEFARIIHEYTSQLSASLGIPAHILNPDGP